MKRVAIVGGGITGLMAAHDLERSTDAEIDLYEAGPRLGGKLRTERIGDLLVEQGPDSLFVRKPGLKEILCDLELESELVSPKRREFMMLVGGRLHRVPAGLVTLNAVQPEAVESADFLSPEGKRRTLREPEPRRETEGDESIRSFFERRFGQEFTRLVAEPLLAGTHGGDADRLSMQALYPAYLGGTGVPPMRATGVPPVKEEPTFVSFENGMQTLVARLAERLRRTRIHLDTAVRELPSADRVLVALPSPQAAKLLPNVGLEALTTRSSAIATFAFPRNAVGHPLDGTGFLVPASENFPLTGATWSSEKWPGRAPDDIVLLRVFMRAAADALSPIKSLLQIEGDPLHADLVCWTDALPQYEVGHLDRIREIETRLPSYVTLAGTSYRGVGVPDCLRQGRDAARAIANSL